MAWTITQIKTAMDQLQTALAKGEQSVTVPFAGCSHRIRGRKPQAAPEGAGKTKVHRAEEGAGVNVDR